MPKSIIIGAGVAGLSAACFLAKAGHDVTIIEKNKTTGGRARVFHAEGFTFDMGPSWYWMPDVFDQFFAHFGKTASDYYELVRLDPGFRIFFSDGSQWDLAAEMKNIEKDFEKIEPGSSAKLNSFLTDARYKYEEGMLNLAYKPSISAREYLDPSLLAKMLRLQMFTNSAKHIRKYFKDPKLVALMEFPLLFLGAKPENIPSLYTLMNYSALQQGTWYPKGGMYKIIEAMTTLAKSLGVNIQTDCPALEMTVAGKRISEVKTQKGNFYPDYVVGAGDYAHVETLLEEPFRNYSEHYWQTRTMAPSCLIFYIGTGKKINGLQHHNLFFDAAFEQHANDIYTDRKWPDDPLFYVCCPSKTDSTVAPPGQENLFILIPVATGLNGSAEVYERYYKMVTARIKLHCGEDITPHVVYRQIYTGTNFIQDYHACQGNAYGLANTLLQTAILKPKIINKKINNLVYAGQLTVPGPGIPPCLISGQIAANHILNHN